MTLNNIKNLKDQKGFTIVELLIVIVVIGILAAITIVAYNGVQNRARTTDMQTAAKQVINKAEVYAADTGNGTYPTRAQLIAATGTSALDQKAKDLLGSSAGAASATKIQYQVCTSGGVRVLYWDFTKSPAAAADQVFTAGDVSTGCANS